jgi:hypothetical protein
VKPPRWLRGERSAIRLASDPVTGRPIRIVVENVGGAWRYWSDLLRDAGPDLGRAPATRFATRTEAENAAVAHLLALAGRTYRALLALRRRPR